MFYSFLKRCDLDYFDRDCIWFLIEKYYNSGIIFYFKVRYFSIFQGMFYE